MPRRRAPRSFHLPDAPPVPHGQAAVVEAITQQTVVRLLGALPLLLPIIERLGLREIVNVRCADTDPCDRDLDVGLVVLLLVCNRLLAPKPLQHVETWLAGTVLPDLVGIDADQMNDDRLARTLDTIVPHLNTLWQDLVVRAATAFDLDLRRLAYDITSISFCGAYEEADLLCYGYSRDHRPDRKQVELATTSLLAGGIPLDYRVLAGNVADSTTPVENLQRLQALLALVPPPPPTQDQPRLVVSDRAMLTLEALAAYQDSDLQLLGPLDQRMAKGAVKDLLAAVDAGELAASPLAYRPQRKQQAKEWEPLQGVSRTLTLPHPDPDRPPLTIDALVVWSPSKARRDARDRTKRLAQLEAAFADLQTRVGKHPYTTRQAIERRVAKLQRRNPVRRLLSVMVMGGSEEESLALTWERDETAIAEAAALDGRYVIGTTAPHLSANEMLTLSRQRDVPEKGYARLKGPLAVRPIYVHTQERMLALVFCTMVALLVFALLELLAQRAALGRSAQMLLAAFAVVSVVAMTLADHSTVRQVAGLSPPLQTILQRLDFPAAPRYLMAHQLAPG